MLYKGFLYGAKLAVLCQSFDGCDFAAVCLNREVQTRLHQFVVEQNRAGAALADDASDVGSREADVFAEKVRKKETWLDVFLVDSTVNGYMNRLFHEI